MIKVTKRITKFRLEYWVNGRKFVRNDFGSHGAAWTFAREVPGATKIDILAYQISKEVLR